MGEMADQSPFHDRESLGRDLVDDAYVPAVQAISRSCGDHGIVADPAFWISEVAALYERNSRRHEQTTRGSPDRHHVVVLDLLVQTITSLHHMSGDSIQLMDIPVFLHPKAYALLTPLADSQEARRIMKSSHLYMIIARPRISATINEVDGIETITFKATAGEGFAAVDFSYRSDLTGLPLHSGDGRPFVGPVELIQGGRRARIFSPDGQPIELDTCQLAAFVSMEHGSQVFRDTSMWEVLYIGQAYGDNGSRAALNRLEEGHRKYTRIATERQFDQDVYVVPVEVAQAGQTAGHYPSTDGPEFTFDNFCRLNAALSTDGRRESSKLLSIVENALIAYFRPVYNDQLKTWPAVSIANEFRNLGVGTFVVILDGAGDIANLKTARRPEAHRSSVFAAELRGARRIVGLHDAEWDDTRPVARLARNAAENAEGSGPTLRFFEP